MPSVKVRNVFFQAEDGIRDAQESRGLGDVYKRQSVGGQWCATGRARADSGRGRPRTVQGRGGHRVGPVSYTHLTLPTIYSV